MVCPCGLSTTGGGSTSECREQDSDANGHLAAKSRSSVLADHLGIGAKGAKRRKASGRALVHARESSETDAALKVLGGGQSLVDDFDDEDFEARKVIVELIY